MLAQKWIPLFLATLLTFVVSCRSTLQTGSGSGSGETPSNQGPPGKDAVLPENMVLTNNGLLPAVDGFNLLNLESGSFPAKLSLLANDIPAADTLSAVINLIPYNGFRFLLYDSSLAKWVPVSLHNPISVPMPAVVNANFDVFVYSSAGGATLELVPWGSDLVRAIDIVRQSGILVKSGDPSRRYVGTVRTTSTAGQVEDSRQRRFVWNYYHRTPQILQVNEPTDSWAYATPTWRPARGSSGNRVELVVGTNESSIDLTIVQLTHPGDANAAARYNGICLDCANTSSLGVLQGYTVVQSAVQITSVYRAPLVTGYHYYTWMELSSGNTTYRGGTYGGVSGMIR